MPAFDLIGWIVIGLLAGSISGWFAKARSVQGCLPTIVVGVLGAVIGGWLATQLGNGPATGFGSALVLAIIGSVVVRLVLRALEGSNRR
ncbi:MAG TPA: GlsB/YeaQ/YmgE family stress response membrane protein [Candidatus Limnocylindria bacterium]|nr:GlsB/YeaQ/YmgE family stress response membrane protein [Candidatus Limnocylindria bacterium]